MIALKLIQNIKWIGFAILIALLVWFYKNYEFQKAENIRQTENIRQIRMMDSLKFHVQNLSAAEIKDYLEWENKDLKNKLSRDKINASRIESIISSKLTYKDSVNRNWDLEDIRKAILESNPLEKEIIDTSKCLTIKGKIKFDGSKLSLDISEREFKNKNDAVVYWERKQWKFLFIKSRLFGKKQFTQKIYNDCGDATMVKIEKKK